MAPGRSIELKEKDLSPSILRTDHEHARMEKLSWRIPNQACRKRDRNAIGWTTSSALRFGSPVCHDLSRSAMAVHQQDGESGSRAQAPCALRHHETPRDQRAANRGDICTYVAPLSVVSERHATGRSRGDEGLGLHLQVQHSLAQDTEGWRL